jgi:hypothetical protein
LQHIRGAANIVRQQHQNLLKTPTGRQLLHLFGRLELSASRHLLIENQYSTTATIDDGSFWDNAPLDIDSLTLQDFSNGNSDFEYAWTEMMKIMVPITILRMIPRQGDKGTSERKEEGERIQGMLRAWEAGLPASFKEVDTPEMMMILEDDEILLHLQPIHYVSHNVAVAMGNPQPNPTQPPSKKNSAIPSPPLQAHFLLFTALGLRV